ncbi:MAG: hypothetical protein EOP11_02960 [Proteobacteria bacterium]|nr:MAG: hypothetical protein EOP11_02960 [Pseudomonadota bacterium]
MPELKEGEDYEIEPGTGLLIFSAAYLKKRGACCESGCRNCPWGYKKSEHLKVPASSEEL